MMKGPKTQLLSLFLLVATVFMLVVGVRAEEIREYSFVRLEHLNEVMFDLPFHKPVFVYLTMPDCVYCQVFEENAFSEVHQALQSRGLGMVIVSYGESDYVRDKYASLNVPIYDATVEYLDIAEIRGFPTFRLLEGDHVVWQRLGFPQDGDATTFDSLWECLDQLD